MRTIVKRMICIGTFGLGGCASEGRLPATHVLTVATAGETVLVGFSNSHGTAGNFELTSIHGESMKCRGKFRYQNLPRGTARFSCTNGESGRARIEAGPGLSGEGSGESSLGPVRIVYGHSIDETNARMTFPEGRRLVQDERGVGLSSTDDAP